MLVYLAGRYGRRAELRGYAEELRKLDVDVTSRWLEGVHELADFATPDEEARRFAAEDLADLERADMIVAFTESPGAVPGRGRGGRHVELGYALASNKTVCVVGHRENVFCHLPQVRHYRDFAAFKDEWFPF